MYGNVNPEFDHCVHSITIGGRHCGGDEAKAKSPEASGQLQDY